MLLERGLVGRGFGAFGRIDLVVDSWGAVGSYWAVERAFVGSWAVDSGCFAGSCLVVGVRWAV